MKNRVYFLCLTLFPVVVLSSPLSIKEASIALKEHIECTFNQNGSEDCLISKRYTILKPEGRSLISKMDYSYAEDNSVEVVLAEYYEPGSNKPIALSPSLIDQRMMPNPEQGYSREKMLSMAFPNLREGSVVNVKLKRHNKKIPFYNGFYFDYVLYPDAIRHDEISMKFTASQKIALVSEYFDDFDVKTIDDKTHHHVYVKLKKTPYFNYFADETVTDADLFYRRSPRIVLANSTLMSDHFGEIASEYQKIITAPLPDTFHTTVYELKNQSFEQQVNGLMEYIYMHYRYLGDWRLSQRGLIPFNLNEIAKNGYGDCKDLSVVLTALLRALNIKAEVVLVFRGAYADKLLIPGVGAPNHVIVRAEKNGQVIWLDPTNPFFNINLILHDIGGRWAMVLDEQGQLRQEHIPESTRVVKKIKEKIRLNDKAKAKIDALETQHVMPLSISLNDRTYGYKVMNDIICHNISTRPTPGFCKIIRQPGTFILPDDYSIKMVYDDNEYLTEISPKTYFLAYTTDKNLFQDLKKYKEKGHLSDINFQYNIDYSRETDITGYSVPQARQCDVTSDWFDVSVRVQPVGRNRTKILYRYARKQQWVDHKTINSVVFQAKVDAIQQCLLNANILIIQ